MFVTTLGMDNFDCTKMNAHLKKFSFPSLAVRLSGRGPGTFPHVSDVTGRKAVERL